MAHLLHKTLRKRLIALKTERNIPTIVRNVSRAKKVVPDGKRQAEVYAVVCVAAFRQMLSVMPNVHLRIIKNIF